MLLKGFFAWIAANSCSVVFLSLFLLVDDLDTTATGSCAPLCS